MVLEAPQNFPSFRPPCVVNNDVPVILSEFCEVRIEIICENGEKQNAENDEAPEKITICQCLLK
jgi:hypothetical protein